MTESPQSHQRTNYLLKYAGFKGAIAELTAGGQRVYTADDVLRIAVIRRLTEMGVSLDLALQAQWAMESYETLVNSDANYVTVGVMGDNGLEFRREFGAIDNMLPAILGLHTLKSWCRPIPNMDLSCLLVIDVSAIARELATKIEALPAKSHLVVRFGERANPLFSIEKV